ncbi:glycosyltransferase family 2 protein [Alcanivorax jadensis]|uniref:glycosyltransferase family 2 protein n=1 Tax=Alcanivorax jadensis TaxID=64988 RepID=UPI0023547674|nr:glycosyltransferase family 2 protein [Alcanivorax jadensis]|tara:strand:+ start:1521 stop:2450 length:930 start_codon:yes stop_codon:yes gene_type:complete
MKNKDNAIRYSFVIPAYNYAGYIASAINSVLRAAAERSDVEVVVVDDGSTDETWALLTAMADKDGRLRVFRQDNQGPSAARNAGAGRGRGEFVWFLDADDRLAEGALSCFDRAIENLPSFDMLFGGYQSFNDRCIGKKNLPVAGLRESKALFLESIFSKLSGLCVGSSIIKRETFMKVRFPVGVHNSEDTVMYSLVIATSKVFSVTEVVVFTRRHGESLRNSISMNVESGFKAAECLFDNDILPAEYRKYRPRFLSYRYLEMSRLYYLNGMDGECLKLYLRGVKVCPRNVFLFSYLRKFIKALSRKVFS